MARTNRGPSSALIWAGPSAFDGQPIAVVVTGLRHPSRNPKTGPMAQVWVIRADVDPVAALHTRQDYAVCGGCPLRRDGARARVCYVNPQTLLSIHWARLRGRIPELAPEAVNARLKARGLAVRLGAYGEMPAAPFWVTRDLVAGGVRWTGYTHQWRDVRYQRFKAYLMASVESEAQAWEARERGWRTFRIGGGLGSPLHALEVRCPASAEMGHRTTCLACGLCNGVSGASWGRHQSVVIAPHGQGARQFIPVGEVRHGQAGLYR